MSTRKCKVLLVDDSESDRALFRTTIERAKIPGVEVVGEAKDGEEAIEYLESKGKFGDWRKHPYPDLLVLDLKMPQRSGFEVLEWLEARGRRPVVVVLSDSRVDADIERALALEADKYLQKTEGLPELIEFIRDFCRGGAAPE